MQRNSSLKLQELKEITEEKKKSIFYVTFGKFRVVVHIEDHKQAMQPEAYNTLGTYGSRAIYLCIFILIPLNFKIYMFPKIVLCDLSLRIDI